MDHLLYHKKQYDEYQTKSVFIFLKQCQQVSVLIAKHPEAWTLVAPELGLLHLLLSASKAVKLWDAWGLLSEWC